MSTPVTRLGFVCPGASSYPLGSPGLLLPAYPFPAEPGAAFHALFGNDNPGLSDLVSGQVLAPNVSFNIVSGGSGGYTQGNTTVSISGGSGSGMIPHAICSGGAITKIAVGNPGVGYLPGDNLTVTITTTGSGTGASATGTVQSTPALQQGYMTVGSSAQPIAGMFIPQLDAAVQTLIGVHRMKANDGTSTMEYGCWPDSGDTIAGGGMLWRNAGVYGAIAEPGVANQAVAPPSGGSGGFILSAMVFGPNSGGAAGTAGRTLYYGDGSTYTAALTKGVFTNRRIGIGCTQQYGGQPNPGTDFAEFMVFNSELSTAQLAGIFARSKQRVGARGITLF